MAESDYVPVGAIVPLGRSVASENQNFLLCDGREVDGDAYSELFAAIGTTFGGDPNTKQFNLPDLRGEFLRGADHMAGADPAVSSRVRKPGSAAEPGGVGTSQNYATARPHSAFTCSVILPSETKEMTGTNKGSAMKGGGDKSVNTCTEGGDPDTRPINVYVEFYIKAQS